MGHYYPRRAFTLIEVLVTVAIIALLIAILVPSLNRAKFQSRVVICQSNLHQLGLGIVSYASEQRVMPFGPNVEGIPPFLEPNDGKLATNQIWTGPQVVLPGTEAKPQPMGLGMLLPRSSMWPQMLYCSADDSNDPKEELAKVKAKTDQAAYSSYLYRQLQETNGKGKLEDLGFNSAEMKCRATALAMDINALLTLVPGGVRTNHKAQTVNVLYRDASARSYDNSKNVFSLRDQDLTDLVGRRAQIFQEADKRY